MKTCQRRAVVILLTLFIALQFITFPALGETLPSRNQPDSFLQDTSLEFQEMIPENSHFLHSSVEEDIPPLIPPQVEGMALELAEQYLLEEEQPINRDYTSQSPEVIERTKEQVQSFDCAIVTDVTIPECEALVALYNSTNGAGWSNNSNWLVTGTVNDWHGVAVVDGYLSSLHLYGNQLSGFIPPELGNLPTLGLLYLNDNQLTGSIPPELGNLTNLHVLNLSYNQLTGSIPPELSNMTNLEDLYLNGNNLTGSIPPELSELTNLQGLFLHSNQLIGNIPTQLGSLTKLHSLYLSSNQLTGNIPVELGNLTQLSYLVLSSNQLSGSIPVELGNMTHLLWLHLNSNQLSGSLPKELVNLSPLYNFDLSSNQLSGSIPLEFINLQVSNIYLNGTNLCEPNNPDFYSWKENRSRYSGTGVTCESSLYSISGKVADENGLPLEGVNIHCNGRYFNKTVTTGIDGDYICDNLPKDTYMVTPSDGSLQSEVNILNLRPAFYGWFLLDQYITQLDFRVNGSNGSFYGVIKDGQTNLPISNATVKLGGAQPITTGISGEYTISSMSGYYELTVNAPGYRSQQLQVFVPPVLSLEKDILLIPYPTNVYRLPYPAGEYRSCTQGNSSSFSHYGKDKFAFDFGHRINKVVAAREGKVMMVKTDGVPVGNVDGCGSKSNYVLIKHADGLASLYVHLKTVSVNKGDWVVSGKEIGIAGNTGCSTGVHLHFMLQDYIPGRWYTNSVPIMFFDVTENFAWNSTLNNYYVVSPSNGVPITGYYYKSANFYLPPQSVELSQQPEALNTVDTMPPEGNATFKLLNSTSYTVKFTAFDYISDNLEMRVARSEEALELLPWVPFFNEINWNYPMIYVQYKDEAGNISEVYTASIESVGYEQPTLDFTTNALICTNQDIGLTNQTTPYCEQCDWFWEFGDGQSSKDMEPTFDNMWEFGFGGYSIPGEYELSMTMKTAIGQYSTSKTIQVFQSPDNGYLISRSGLTVDVSSVDENAIDWIWDFGDGSVEHGRNASHTYNSEDEFPPYISLQVISENNCQNINYFEVPSEVEVFLPLINH